MDTLKDKPGPVGAAMTRVAATPTREHDNRIKLPKLTMQPFSGDLTMWTPFGIRMILLPIRIPVLQMLTSLITCDHYIEGHST